MSNYYDILGIPLNASPQQIDVAYSQKNYPKDTKSEATQKVAYPNFQLLQEAYETLRNPETRKKHDESIKNISSQKISYENFIDLLNLANDEWINEEEFKNRFGKIPFTVEDFAKIGIDLRQHAQYNPKAGYYLLYMIKALAPNLVIPSRNSFTQTSVEMVLSEQVSKISPDISLQEMFHYQGHSRSPLYRTCLSHNAKLEFLSCSITALKEKNLASCLTNKNQILAHLFEEFPILFECLNREGKMILANVFIDCEDSRLKSFGTHLLSALEATSKKIAVTHLYEILKTFPDLMNVIAREFGIPLRSLCSSSQKFPDFVREYRHDLNTIFKYPSYTIGVYNFRLLDRSNKELPPYLYAYNYKEDKVLWGMPIFPDQLEVPSSSSSSATSNTVNPHIYSLDQTKDHISLRFKNDNKIYFINKQSGTIDMVSVLPEFVTNFYYLHITSDFHFYYLNRTEQGSSLIIGKIENGVWEKSVEHSIDQKFWSFYPLGNYCGIGNDLEKKSIIYDLTGKKETFSNVEFMSIEDGKLYTIEKNNENQRSFYLRVRNLQSENEKIVSEVQVSIPFRSSNPSIAKICKRMIIVKDFNSATFINLSNSSVFTTSLDSDPRHNFFADDGSIWSFDSFKKKLRILKLVDPSQNLTVGITEEEIELNAGYGTTLLHLDDKNRQLYIKP